MYCNKCGAQYSDSSAFCPKCGASANTSTAANYNGTPRSAPNSAISLILGIVSVIVFWIPYIGVFLGLILGIVGAILAGSGLKTYKAAPANFTGKGALVPGKVFSIIGIIINGLLILLVLLFYIFAKNAAEGIINMVG